MSKKLRVGLIGCGNVVSYGHKPALKTLESVELVALADITDARRKIGQEWFGLSDENLYKSHYDLLARPDVDAVCITVPQRFRHQIILDVIEKGKHILSEKPIAYAPSEAEELIKAADDAGLVFGMVHNYHFLPEYKKIKGLVEADTIGELRMLTMHFLGVIDYPGVAEYKADWRHTMDAGGGILMDMIHAVYLAEWLFGAPAQQVMAFVDSPTYAYREPVVEDLALVQVAFPTGYASIQAGWGQGTGGVDASGSEGHLRMRYNEDQTSGFNRSSELYSVRNWQRTDHDVDNLPIHMGNIGRSFTQLWANFRAAILDGSPLIAHATAGKRALELVLGAYLSGVSGQGVALPLESDHPVYQRGIRGLGEIEAWPHSRTKAAGLFGLR